MVAAVPRPESKILVLVALQVRLETVPTVAVKIAVPVEAPSHIGAIQDVGGEIRPVLRPETD